MEWNNTTSGEAEVQPKQTLSASQKSTRIDVTQQLHLLDDRLSSTISIVQNLLGELPYMGGELGFAADAAYQKKVAELYNMVKDWVG